MAPPQVPVRAGTWVQQCAVCRRHTAIKVENRTDMDDSREAQNVIETAEQKDDSHLIVGFEIEGACVIHRNSSRSWVAPQGRIHKTIAIQTVVVTSNPALFGS